MLGMHLLCREMQCSWCLIADFPSQATVSLFAYSRKEISLIPVGAQVDPYIALICLQVISEALNGKRDI